VARLPGISIDIPAGPVSAAMMSRILMVTPGAKVRHSGNRCTASQWAEILRRQGHRVVVCYDVPEVFPAAESDLLLAMHAVRCAGVIEAYRAAFPRGRVLLALTGTDIYPDPSATALATMRAVDGLIVLQEKAMEKVPPDCRSKTSVVIQSATPRAPVRTTARRAGDPFNVCVVGHFRGVKDPLLTAHASRLVPPASRLRVRQAGGILEASYAAQVAQEQRENPRYEWLGELSVDEVAALMATSDLMVLTSRHEGGARVVGESIVHGTPVLSTRIDGVLGLLGDDYPGFFPAGDAGALAGLLWRCESDSEFMAQVRQSAREREARFAPEAEDRALAAAVRKIFPTRATA
jgi:putative glycosyltransferase (TIGR04348 family)